MTEGGGCVAAEAGGERGGGGGGGVIVEEVVFVEERIGLGWVVDESGNYDCGCEEQGCRDKGSGEYSSAAVAVVVAMRWRRQGG